MSESYSITIVLTGLFFMHLHLENFKAIRPSKKKARTLLVLDELTMAHFYHDCLKVSYTLHRHIFNVNSPSFQALKKFTYITGIHISVFIVVKFDFPVA